MVTTTSLGGTSKLYWLDLTTVTRCERARRLRVVAREDVFDEIDNAGTVAVFVVVPEHTHTLSEINTRKQSEDLNPRLLLVRNFRHRYIFDDGVLFFQFC